MYKVTKRDCPMFGIGPYVCEFICDTASDISTLPTSTSEGSGGRTAYDNQKCASGSIAIVVENGAESKQYMLNNQDVWCPYSVATASSSDSVLEEAKAYTDSEIADLINGAPTTRDTLKEISDAMAENQTVVETLDAAIGTKANKTDIPTKVSELENDSGYLTEHQDLSEYAKKTDVPSIKVNSAVNADTVNGHTVNADVPADAKFTDTVPDLNPYALRSKYDDTTINVGRKADTMIGLNSTAEGRSTTASGNCSHAEGYSTTANGVCSHAEGQSATASEECAHAEGSNTTASGIDSHAEGTSTTASGVGSHAEGNSTTASGNCSHTEGVGTSASGTASHTEGAFTIADNECSHAGGHYSADMTTGGSIANSVGTAFIIGNGTSKTAKSNAFSVMFNGTVKAKSTITASTTADYAEFFEWLDGNPNEEDRVGYFVTMDGDKIRIANADDDYILGVVSGEPFVLGNGDCDTWNGMFLRDEFRRTIYEPAPKIEEILDDEGNPTGEFKEIEGTYDGIRPKLNPEYDHTQAYISRFDRPEWAPIGMLGVLAVRHDGTAKVNGYVTIADSGIATACDKNTENSYRVIKANTDSVVEIIFR